MPDNLSGPPIGKGEPIDPSVGGFIPRPTEEVWPDELELVINNFEANTNDTPTYWIYEGWADAGGLLEENTGAGTAQKFADWRARTTDAFGYTTWFDNLLAQTKANVPTAASRIKIIPVARTMVSVMENTAASTITADEWFEDNAPHGHDTAYLLVAMIVYSTLYQEQAPMPDFTGADINDTFLHNYNSIAEHIFRAI